MKTRGWKLKTSKNGKKSQVAASKKAQRQAVSFGLLRHGKSQPYTASSENR